MTRRANDQKKGVETMRLTKQQEVQATTELLMMLANDGANGGEGLLTSKLWGNLRFHGELMLSHKQINRLLQDHPSIAVKQVKLAGAGARTSNLWSLKPSIQRVCNKASRVISGIKKLEQAHGGTFAIK
jgi:hypothetical protein